MNAQKTGAPISWYFSTFVTDPTNGYAVMNPTGADKKYVRKHEPLTWETVKSAMFGGTRRLPIKGTWQTFPLSISVRPEHRDGWTSWGAFDLDEGGEQEIVRVLSVLKTLGLWAFSALSEGEKHSGGHVFIPFDAPVQTKKARDSMVEIARRTGVSLEIFPNNQNIRLPLMHHLRAPGGPRRFPLLLQDGSKIPAEPVSDALCALQSAWTHNKASLVASLAPSQIVSAPSPKKALNHVLSFNPMSVRNVIDWFNDRFHLGDLLGVPGLRGRTQIRCPFHDDHSPSMAIWERNGHLVCKCFSSGCVASDAQFWDAFNVYCYLERLSVRDAIRRISDEYRLGERHRNQQSFQKHR